MSNRILSPPGAPPRPTLEEQGFDPSTPEGWAAIEAAVEKINAIRRASCPRVSTTVGDQSRMAETGPSHLSEAQQQLEAAWTWQYVNYSYNRTWPEGVTTTINPFSPC
ncbi:hypothetical protein [Aeoliella sp.]|uniref:hypothetical protein n=1 Tax=Aeoliella sp. TaxID=2795800 RepID=UPI003CCBA17E